MGSRASARNEAIGQQLHRWVKGDRFYTLATIAHNILRGRIETHVLYVYVEYDEVGKKENKFQIRTEGMPYKNLQVYSLKEMLTMSSDLKTFSEHVTSGSHLTRYVCGTNKLFVMTIIVLMKRYLYSNPYEAVVKFQVVDGPGAVVRFILEPQDVARHQYTYVPIDYLISGINCPFVNGKPQGVGDAPFSMHVLQPPPDIERAISFERKPGGDLVAIETKSPHFKPGPPGP